MNVKQWQVSRTQEEADTLMIHHAVEVASNGMNIHIYSRDMDVNLLAPRRTPVIGDRSAAIMDTSEMRRKVSLQLKLLKLDDIMKFQLGTFMYKLKYNKLPSAIPHMFVTNENIHSHNTRNKNGYLIPNVRTNCRKFTVSYAGPILWNSFPQKLRQLPSEVLFKRKLKYILLATY